MDSSIDDHQEGQAPQAISKKGRSRKAKTKGKRKANKQISPEADEEPAQETPSIVRIEAPEENDDDDDGDGDGDDDHQEEPAKPARGRRGRPSKKSTAGSKPALSGGPLDKKKRKLDLETPSSTLSAKKKMNLDSETVPPVASTGVKRKRRPESEPSPSQRPTRAAAETAKSSMAEQSVSNLITG